MMSCMLIQFSQDVFIIIIIIISIIIQNLIAIVRLQWAISNNGFLLDSLYEKKIGEDLVFNNALPKSLTITQIACLKAKAKLHNGMVYSLDNSL